MPEYLSGHGIPIFLTQKGITLGFSSSLEAGAVLVVLNKRAAVARAAVAPVATIPAPAAPPASAAAAPVSAAAAPAAASASPDPPVLLLILKCLNSRVMPRSSVSIKF